MSAGILLIAGLVPKFSALLTTIPQCVLGGATISVFASIAMTGIKLITSQPMSYRNTSIVGLSVALGVGAFLVVALLRILFGIALPPLLFSFYILVFVLAMFVPENFLAVAFDSGGVTTGPMTVPLLWHWVLVLHPSVMINMPEMIVSGLWLYAPLDLFCSSDSGTLYTRKQRVLLEAG